MHLVLSWFFNNNGNTDRLYESQKISGKINTILTILSLLFSSVAGKTKYEVWRGHLA